MRVVMAPDSFTGTLTAGEAAAAMARGWRRIHPDTHIDEIPLSDGGPGFAHVLGAVSGQISAERNGGMVSPVQVTGPLRTPVTAHVVHQGRTAYIESAECCGLHLVPAELRDPRTTTTAGVGEAIAAAVDAGTEQVVIGLGGSATNDAGAGALGALGARAFDEAGCEVPLDRGGGGLGAVARVDLAPALARLDGVRLVVASDVDSPLLGSRGAAQGFAPQKGATASQVAELESNLALFGAAMGLPSATTEIPGAGAAGGLGFALLALGAEFTPGIAVVAEALGLRERFAAADLVVTGEGSLDWQSLGGKVVVGVAALGRRVGTPVAVVVGRLRLDPGQWRDLGITAAVAAVGPDDPEPEDPAEAVAEAAARLAARWSRE